MFNHSTVVIKDGAGEQLYIIIILSKLSKEMVENWQLLMKPNMALNLNDGSVKSLELSQRLIL